MKTFNIHSHIKVFATTRGKSLHKVIGGAKVKMLAGSVSLHATNTGANNKSHTRTVVYEWAKLNIALISLVVSENMMWSNIMRV